MGLALEEINQQTTEWTSVRSVRTDSISASKITQ